jgi:NTP pyrophosphatase (non-canonical NTP hydrolase)
MITIGEYIQEIGAWQRETFPHATDQSVIAHLQKEVLTELPFASRGDLPYELADCLMLLFSLADRNCIDLEMALREKLAINRARTWGAVNAQGFVEHIRE